MCRPDRLASDCYGLLFIGWLVGGLRGWVGLLVDCLVWLRWLARWFVDSLSLRVCVIGGVVRSVWRGLLCLLVVGSVCPVGLSVGVAGWLMGSCVVVRCGRFGVSGWVVGSFRRFLAGRLIWSMILCGGSGWQLRFGVLDWFGAVVWLFP